MESRTRTSRRRFGTVLAAAGLAALIANAFAAAAPSAVSQAAAAPNFGSNVVILDPGMPQAMIQSTLDAISTQQVPNQFGT